GVHRFSRDAAQARRQLGNEAADEDASVAGGSHRDDQTFGESRPRRAARRSVAGLDEMTKTLRVPFALAAVLVAASAFAGPHVTHTFSSSAPLGTARRVFVDVETGDITIRNSATATINVRGTIKRETDYDESEKNQRIVDDSSAEIYVNRDEAIVRRKFGPNAQGWRAQTHNAEWSVTIEVPVGVSVELGTRYGDIDVEGTF